MVQPNPEHHLIDFQRDPSLHLRRLRETGAPEILRVDDGSAIVIQDAAACRRMLEAIDLAEANGAIREALVQASRGEGRDAAEVLESIRRDLGLRAISQS